jgi:hypothetical protein
VRLLIAVLLVVALLAGADVATREAAEDQLVELVRARVDGAGATTAEIDSLPFLGRLAVVGDVDHVTVHMDDVTAASLSWAAITVELDGVRIDRGRLVRDRKVAVTDLDRGTVTAVLGLSQVLRLASSAIRGDVRLEDGALVVGETRIDLAAVPLLPCASDLAFVGATVVLTCTFDEVPRELARDAVL